MFGGVSFQVAVAHLSVYLNQTFFIGKAGFECILSIQKVVFGWQETVRTAFQCLISKFDFIFSANSNTVK